MSMFKEVSHLALAVISLAAAACGSNPSTASDASTQDGSTPPAKLLAVLDAHEIGELGGLSPQSPGRRFVVVSVEVTNTSSVSIPVAMTFFFAQTDGGLELLAAPASAAVVIPCAADTKLLPGGSTFCQVVFEAPTGDLPTLLIYRFEGGVSAEAALTVRPCVTCDSECVDVATNPLHCGQCSRSVTLEQACVGGKITCTDPSLSTCGDRCVDLKADPQHCGACDKPVGNLGSCAEGSIVCMAGALECGAAGCVDPKSDEDHCGQCWRSCSAERSCYSGTACWFQVTKSRHEYPGPCNQICEAEGAECLQGLAHYERWSSYQRDLDLLCTATPELSKNFDGSTYTLSHVHCDCIVPF